MRFRTILGEKLINLRTAKGWSTGQLAEASGVSRPYVWQLETGGKDSPSFEILEKLAQALGVSVSEFSETAETSPKNQALPKGLKEFSETRGKALGVTAGDLAVLRQVNFRGSQPTESEDWELLFLFLKKWARK